MTDRFLSTSELDVIAARLAKLLIIDAAEVDKIADAVAARLNRGDVITQATLSDVFRCGHYAYVDHVRVHCAGMAGHDGTHHGHAYGDRSGPPVQWGFVGPDHD